MEYLGACFDTTLTADKRKFQETVSAVLISAICSPLALGEMGGRDARITQIKQITARCYLPSYSTLVITRHIFTYNIIRWD